MKSEIHHRADDGPPLDRILSQVNPVQPLQTDLFKNQFSYYFSIHS